MNVSSPRNNSLKVLRKGCGGKTCHLDLDKIKLSLKIFVEIKAFETNKLKKFASNLSSLKEILKYYLRRKNCVINGPRLKIESMQ